MFPPTLSVRVSPYAGTEVTDPKSVAWAIAASDEDTDTVLTIPPETVADTVTGMLTTGRTVPAGTGRVPAYVQVTVCAAVPHDPFVPVAVPGTMPEGRVSVRVTTLDSAVPPEETTP